MSEPSRSSVTLPAQGNVTLHSRIFRIRPPLAAARSHTDHFSALADWNSDHRWIFREVLCLQRSASGEPGGIGNYRSAQQCRGSVLLLASDGCDVHARAARRSAASARSEEHTSELQS